MPEPVRIKDIPENELTPEQRKYSRTSSQGAVGC